MAAIASRYARAFVDVVARHRENARRMIEEYEECSQMGKSSAEWRSVLENPAVPREQKFHLLDELGARTGVSQPVRNFIAILVEKRRLGLLPEIAETIKSEIHG